mgnify:CR=1 FL=1
MASETNIPLRRTQYLTSFSHEHHHGLVFCSRLKKTAFVDKELIQDYARDFWNRYLDVHFDNEEQLLLPIVSDREIAKRFLAEHKAIRFAFWKIDTPCGDKYEQAKDLSRLLNEHIRFEERIMFPFLEKTALPELQKIITSDHGDLEAHGFLPEFWNNENK